MKLLAVFAALSMAQDTPHDPEAQAFCEGKQEGYYANPKDCGSYFFCWNQGKYGDKMYCAPGTVFHPRLLECTWPYCLPGDNECYEPCGSPCAGWTPEEIREQCADSHDVTTSSP